MWWPLNVRAEKRKSVVGVGVYENEKSCGDTGASFTGNIDEKESHLKDW